MLRGGEGLDDKGGLKIRGHHDLDDLNIRRHNEKRSLILGGKYDKGGITVRGHYDK